jgi:hypothetical protein
MCITLFSGSIKYAQISIKSKMEIISEIGVVYPTVEANVLFDGLVSDVISKGPSKAQMELLPPFQLSLYFDVFQISFMKDPFFFVCVGPI